MGYLIEAVRNQDVKMVQTVLQGNPGAVDKEGVAALFLAAESGCFPVLQHLVEYSAVNLCERDEQFNSVLYYAVLAEHLEMIRYLTERGGMDPMEANRAGITPFDVAYQKGQTAVIQYFQEYLGVDYGETYHNPVVRGAHPDPSVVRVGEDYYMVNSSFCYFPCIPISHSRDLVHWQVIGHAITRPEYSHLDELESGRGYWAPDISYYEGRFYITATYRLNEVNGLRRKQMVTVAERPEGPYSEPVFIDEDGIDPSIFHDEDGRRYMLVNRGARIFELSDDGTRKISEPQLLYYGNCKKTSEGPHLLKKDGYYYLLQAEGGTGRGHRITVSRSETLMGVYRPSPYNPLIQQQDERAPIQCCGHGKLVETPDGDWYLFYLCVRMLDGTYGILGRETAMEPVIWTSDGWPVANEGRGPSSQQRCSKLPAHVWAADKSQHDGAVSWDDLGWITPRPPYPDTIRIDGDMLLLHGSGSDLNSLSCRCVRLRRQKEFSFAIESEMMVPEELKVGDSLGLTCYYDENSYLKFGYGKQNHACGLILQEYIDSEYVRSDFYPLELNAGDRLKLKIKTTGLVRRCYWQTNGIDLWQPAGVCHKTEYLSSEGLRKGKRFTGAMAGVYVHGEWTGKFCVLRMLY